MGKRPKTAIWFSAIFGHRPEKQTRDQWFRALEFLLMFWIGSIQKIPNTNCGACASAGFIINKHEFPQPNGVAYRAQTEVVMSNNAREVTGIQIIKNRFLFIKYLILL